MKVHMVAICGTGMGALAGLLKEAGHDVRGSDKAFYPPMGERLQAWGIPTQQGFDAARITPDLDLVVVGNACRQDNPEARAALERGLKVMSFPQALGEMFIEGRRSIAVCGTHGKTTTASLLAYMLVQAGRDPSFLVGGVPTNFGKSFHVGRGTDFVVEGDEYDTAFFDKRPKFVHYRPRVVVLTAVEYDHADIYPDMDAYRRAFQGLVGLLPPDGLLIGCADDPEVRALFPRAACPSVGYGLAADAGYRVLESAADGQGMAFRVRGPDGAEARLRLPLAGRHNVLNATAALAVLGHLGLGLEEAARTWEGFLGIARRLEVRGVAAGVTVLDDFAHHPTKVRETVRAARLRYPRANLVAVFEPRTNTSRRKVFQELYPGSFEGADRVVVVPPFGVDGLPAAERFDSAALVAALRARGLQAELRASADEVVSEVSPGLPEGSVVLVMSNGAFDGIHEKLLAALRRRGG
ncbi:MAG TPA: UDP-N-acetylmuramate--L-alanine ligase [Myxococcota bacterium]|nr:UDP-N-acetylmuramate--L-alanine ligase [Myxococcota bacterium]HRY92884.1 UDP-N-acetylmuramate--L-alanine ligase [Myxococcota bacterium]HSA21522.1 UDP-N-acetylmuramate--L-alanine ligase [Myxococcota bacterium]